jgi:hypothetical protein
MKVIYGVMLGFFYLQPSKINHGGSGRGETGNGLFDTICSHCLFCRRGGLDGNDSTMDTASSR